MGGKKERKKHMSSKVCPVHFRAIQEEPPRERGRGKYDAAHLRKRRKRGGSLGGKENGGSDASCPREKGKEPSGRNII